MLNNDRIRENEYLEKVRSFLDSECVRLNELMDAYRNDVRAKGAKFNLDNPNGGMYSKMELTELHYEMEKQMAEIQNAEYEISFFRNLRKAPYFARIDFKSDSMKAARPVYLGLRTLQNESTFEMFVCDWRAPVASLFYEDFEGKAYYDAPRGRIEGDILLKRQYKFENGELKYYFDSDLKIDDDILSEVLSQASTDHLKVIVNSIQRDQNKAIRYTDKTNFLVCGPAGSGKTSVGFHRIAYLLYQNRSNLSSGEVIMFSNNDIFSSYVADIIPELGEVPINYSSFYRIFNAELPSVETDDYYELAEDIIKGNKTRAKCAEKKLGDEFSNYLTSCVLGFVPEFSDICAFGSVVVSADELKKRYEEDWENSPLVKAKRIVSFANGKVDEFFVNNRDDIYRKLDDESEIDEDTAKIYKSERRRLKERVSSEIKARTVVDPVLMYKEALRKYAADTGESDMLLSLRSLEKGVLRFEDAVCALWCKCVMGTAAEIASVKHVLIDEAQDISILQHKIILHMFPRAKYTLLADANQAIVGEINTGDMEKLASLYDADTFTLEKSYRSTKEINDYALQLLPPEKRYDVFERHGEDVAEINDETQFLEKLAEYSRISPSVAVITKTSDEAVILYNQLRSNGVDIRLCDNRSCELGASPMVIPLSLTKGLEFDSVLVYNRNELFNDKAYTADLYMASTRALHRLGIVNL